MEKSINLLTGVIIILFSIISCKLDVPIREMSMAKTTITRAIEVKSEKYSPEELNAAKNLLLECHTEIMKEELDKAKTLAEKSAAEAEKAIEKSLPLLANDSLSEAKKIFDEADLLYASKYSPASFACSENLLREASSLQEAKQYWESYQKSTEALTNALKAKSDSEPYIPKVKEEINTTLSIAEDLNTKGGERYASPTIATIKEKLIRAKEKVDASNLKESVPLLEEAKTLLADAQEQTLRGASSAKIADAENLLTQTKNHSLSSSYKNEIANAEEIIKTAKNLHENKDYHNSIGKADHAISLLSELGLSLSVKENELKGEAEARLSNAKKLLEEKKKIDGSRFAEKIATASKHVEQGEKLFHEKEYVRSLNESDSALAILQGIQIEGIEPETATKIKYGEEPATYTVKYNPKDRDCLWKISWRTYGNPKFWPLIYVANKDKIRDPDLIFPGQVLTIPIIPERSKVIKEEKKQNAKQELQKS
ncbi:MAG: LysM peptidoglycan-binding domain-containing protein [Spirochaetes bacterium]|nr:LysM peptidoglycan-binding domain-containing protein [Spirochaetota bacterium]